MKKIKEGWFWVTMHHIYHPKKNLIKGHSLRVAKIMKDPVSGGFRVFLFDVSSIGKLACGEGYARDYAMSEIPTLEVLKEIKVPRLRWRKQDKNNLAFF